MADSGKNLHANILCCLLSVIVPVYLHGRQGSIRPVGEVSYRLLTEENVFVKLKSPGE
jgi:hypothetical protein